MVFGWLQVFSGYIVVSWSFNEATSQSVSLSDNFKRVITCSQSVS